MAGIAGGAEVVLVAEIATESEQVARELRVAYTESRWG